MSSAAPMAAPRDARGKGRAHAPGVPAPGVAPFPLASSSSASASSSSSSPAPGPGASAASAHGKSRRSGGASASASHGRGSAFASSSGAGASASTTAALASAYQELGKELSSSRLRSIGNYTLGRPIGEGTFGKVRLGTHRLIPNSRVAIKQIPKNAAAALLANGGGAPPGASAGAPGAAGLGLGTGLAATGGTSTQLQSLIREIHHHRRLHHPHVMQLYEVLATENYIWMVSELCAGGELYDYLVESPTGCLEEAEARRIFGQLCLAVAYVHEKGIVHRDLKLENVLLDERCNVKLGDFGFTREFEERKLMDTFCGTTGYAAPEMLAGKKYLGKQVDVWSLGVILYALLCGALPFDDDDEDVMKTKILQGDYDLPPTLSEEARDLVKSILVKNPHARPSIPDMLKHAWFTKAIPPLAPSASGAPGAPHAGTPPPATSMSTVAEDPATSSSAGASVSAGSSRPHSPARSGSAASQGCVSASEAGDEGAAAGEGPHQSERAGAAPARTRTTSSSDAVMSAGHSSASASASTSDSTPDSSLVASSGGGGAAAGAKEDAAAAGDTSAALDSSAIRRKRLSQTHDKELPQPPPRTASRQRSSSGGGAGLLQSPARPGLSAARHDSQATLTGAASLHRDDSAADLSLAGSSVGAGAGPGLATHAEDAADEASAEAASAEGSAPSADAESQQHAAPAAAGIYRSYSQHSSRGGHGGHHRTPSRSKRRSTSSVVLSDHHAPAHDASGRAVDYSALLKLLQPALFSTPVEQNLLASLSTLGLDVGQIVHSVLNDACDSSGALWWLLKRKADEKQALMMHLNAALSAGAQPAAASSGAAPSPSLYPSTLAGLGSMPLASASSTSVPDAALSYLSSAPPVPPKEVDDMLRARMGSRKRSGGGHPTLSRSKRDVAVAADMSATSSAAASTPRQGKAPSAPAHKAPPPADSPGEKATPPPEKGRTASSSTARQRSTSFTMRQLTSVLAGMSKERLVDDDGAAPGASEHSKSPVSVLFGKRSATSTPSRASKQDTASATDSPRKSGHTPSMSPHLAALQLSSQEADLSASPSSSARSDLRGGGALSNSASMASMSTVASTADTADTGKSKSRRSKFMTTVRTWLGSEDKAQPASNQAAGKSKKKKGAARAAELPPVMTGQVATVRKRASPYPQGSVRGSRNAMPHSPLRPSVSRMSSSNSVYGRPHNLRRQSGSTIMLSPAHEGLGIAMRQASRPSSIQSIARRGSGLHGRMGSVSSSGSGVKQVANDLPGGSLRHRRRASSEGGTIVQRHRVYTGSATHSRRHSRADTSESAAVDAEDLAVPDTPRAQSHRRSFESRDSHEHGSGGHYKTQFLAHKNYTPFKPPSLHRHASRDGVSGHSHSQSQPHVPTWMRSWGKPPPHWEGRIDDEPSKSEILDTLRPKLRDVFAQSEESEWEDEDEEPAYLGGLGQTASAISASNWTWGTRSGGVDSPYASKFMSVSSARMADEARPKSMRSLFTPPSLGSETAPRIISASAPSPAEGLPNQGEGSGSTLSALAAGSRIRAATSPALKAPIEEEEEED